MSASAHLIQMFDSTIVRAHVSAAGAKGGKGQALGRWRGGFTTKIHAKADASGTIIGFDLTGGEASDTRHFETLLDIGLDMKPRAVVCDKGYASKANRRRRGSGASLPCDPAQGEKKERPKFFAKALDIARARIEQGFGRLKRFKRVALRCEKTERNFRSIGSFAAGLCLIQFVHTAYNRRFYLPNIMNP